MFHVSQVNTTISSLDALLGPQATAAPASTRAASSAAASTSGSSTPSAAPAPRPASRPAVEPGTSSPAAARKPPSFSFDQVQGFAGLAPEVINGRAAMLGFLFAISNELKTGESIFSQMITGGGAQALVVILAVTIASFAPALRAPLDEVFNKVPAKAQEWGPFTATAESINGRAAMLGLALLIFLEGANPQAFFL
ncbi:Desiccation stress protein DSP-22, chloroplastic [Tetrabaena socialis]|uniref:Desiccation stress protein DSP-22, chloroplastic n=1 Tax=Tetrabaena socialis TaxID=47790 RepID=A0A2J8AE95_9CHLO|nr:Desiccation stress protein DSP-22, chloroplastic [Tetrabaena socialis]|eukprot:PNH10837.1 Desiccation stress protein DSP-22, chloroplastic [Tetrabaena socialis]